MRSTRSRRSLLSLLAATLPAGLLCAPLALGAADPAAPPGPESLVGVWRLDEDHSQSLREAMHQAFREGRHDGGFEGGPRDGGGGGHPGGGPPGSGFPRGGFSSPVAEEDVEKLGGDGDSPRELDISYAAPRFTFASPGGPTRIVTADGSKTKEERPGHGTVKVRATFQDGELQIDERPEKGPERNVLYRVAPASDGGRQLIVVLSLASRGRMPPIAVRRVYLPAPPAPAAAPPNIPPAPG